MSPTPGYARDPAGTQPPLDTPAYGSSRLRAPHGEPVPVAHSLTEITGPLAVNGPVSVVDTDLTRQHHGAPLGERIIVHGRILDGGGQPIPNTLIEIWQANAAGRYVHAADQHPAPLDPNFSGTGRCLTDRAGRYEFVTIKPGAYPWKNHHNAWRPAHIHFSLLGRAFAQRLVTQMYFPGDPLLAHDPIYNAVPDERARQRLVSRLDLDRAVPEWALGYAFDVVLRGREATLLTPESGESAGGDS
jgi:protocatechuate 3,4-dioxygenase beta subunit